MNRINPIKLLRMMKIAGKLHGIARASRLSTLMKRWTWKVRMNFLAPGGINDSTTPTRDGNLRRREHDMWVYVLLVSNLISDTAYSNQFMYTMEGWYLFDVAAVDGWVLKSKIASKSHIFNWWLQGLGIILYKTFSWHYSYFEIKMFFQVDEVNFLSGMTRAFEADDYLHVKSDFPRKSQTMNYARVFYTYRCM